MAILRVRKDVTLLRGKGDVTILRLCKYDVTILMKEGTRLYCCMYCSSKNDGGNQTPGSPLLPTAILHIKLHNMADIFKVHHIATINICEMRIAGGLVGIEGGELQGEMSYCAGDGWNITACPD